MSRRVKVISAHREGLEVTAGSYAGGCRCNGCRDAHRVAANEYRRRQIAARPVVSAEERAGRARAAFAARFWSKVDTNGPGGCWLWVAGKNRTGYGIFSVDCVARLAHRIAYELVRGPIPDDLTLDHGCRVRNCVNPAHLTPMTIRENQQMHYDWMRRERLARGGCVNGHPYTEASVYVGRTGQWFCRPCNAERTRRRSARLRAGRAA